jgi:hypothetical protein
MIARKLWWAGRVARTEEALIAYRILVRKPRGKSQLKKRMRQEDSEIWRCMLLGQVLGSITGVEYQFLNLLTLISIKVK